MSTTDKQKQRKANRKKDVAIVQGIVIVLLVLIIALAAILLQNKFFPKNSSSADLVLDSEVAAQVETAPAETAAENVVAETTAQTASVEVGSGVVAQADKMAAQYDYDGAMALLQAEADYGTNTELQTKVAAYQASKDACVSYPIDQVKHVFFHTMIWDTSLAFDGDSNEAGYNQVMTTMSEFEKIMNSMYEKGYVLVSVHDMMGVNEDGSMYAKEIYLPEGKMPFVLSQDDVSYYHYMDGDGMATKLVLDENGKVKNEYKETDGSISVGDYDMVPWIDTFVEAHPDFSYHGRKGTIALTGYNGVLGYRTDIAYLTRENLDEYQVKFFEEHPDFDETTYQNEIAEATKVADAMKANGWEFASHTWGHRNATTDTVEQLQTDNEKWMAYVSPIVGPTDIIIFAFGADIGTWEGYSDDNAKFAYFKSQGFNYYCNVDSSTVWVQLGSNYMRQGRRNLDGYRMYYDMIDDTQDFLSDLFDVNAVFDPARPTPVPPM